MTPSDPSYGPAADGIAAERGLVRWHSPRPGVTLQDGRLHETLTDGLLGLWRLDYSPLVRMAWPPGCRRW